MASKTQIANRALSKVGDTRVSNIETDGSERALVINEMYEQVRDALLQSYPWNFAIKRTNLALDGTSPNWGWANRYQLPSDCLALLDIKTSPDYRVEGGYILTDNGAPLYIRYIKSVTSEGEFDAMFTEAFAAELAVESSERLSQSNTKKQILIAERDEIIKRAFANDAIADPPQSLPDDEWLLSREFTYDDDINYNL